MTVSLAEEFNDFNIKLVILRICETQNDLVPINIPMVKMAKQEDEIENSDEDMVV